MYYSFKNCVFFTLQVVFTNIIQSYKELRSRMFTDRLFDRHFKIGFCSEEIKNAYELLLQNCCKICDNLPPFRAFSMLSDHMRKVHERYFCDLCVKHLKVQSLLNIYSIIVVKPLKCIFNTKKNYIHNY